MITIRKVFGATDEIAAIQIGSGLEPKEVWLTKDQVEMTHRYMTDDLGNTAIMIRDSEGTESLYIVQSIDLDFS